MNNHHAISIRLFAFACLCLFAHGSSSLGYAGDRPPQPAAAVDTGVVLWMWLAWAGIIFFAMLMAILMLVRRLKKTSNALQAEKHRHFMSTEKAIRNEALVNEIYNSTNDIFFFHDLDGNMKDVNAAGLRETGYTRDQWQRLNIRDMVPEYLKPECDRYLERIRKNETDRGYMKIHTPAGAHMLLEYNNSLIKDAYGRPTGVRGIARNVTEQHNTRMALKKSEEKYRTILASIEDAYYEVDIAGNIIFFNNAMLRMFGYSPEELKGKNYRAFTVEKDKETIFKTFNHVFQTGKPVKAFDWQFIRKDNTVCHVETSVSLNLDKNNDPIGFFGIMRDLTPRLEGEKRRQELEAQLHQSQKLESIGTLAGGIAHDFNNILFPLIGYTEMTMDELPEDSPLRDNLDKVMKSANRAKAMIQQILAFSRQSKDEFAESVQITPVVRETVKLLRSTFPSTITVEETIAKDIGMVSIDVPRLHQVIMNLCTNALHAVADNPSGRIEITAEQVHITENDAGRFPNLTAGDYVKIRIADNGEGIDPEIAGKIFEPYFTTKPHNKGTGLGLSVSYGIVKNAGGIIQVNSAPGKGAQFDVFLPVAEKPMGVPVKSEGFFQPPPTGTETVLLVDDEHRIAELEQHMIESLGYRVFSRTSSIEALAAFKNNPHKFDIVVTDQTMPNMTGIELAKAILAIRPGIPVIICTGFSEKVTAEKIERVGIKALLTKPIPKIDMAIALRNALDAATPKNPGTNPANE